MKYLIVGNLHTRLYKLERMEKAEKPDVVILLGDYFDGYGVGTVARDETISFIKNNLDNKKYVFLLGEQDVQYLWPTEVTACANFKHGVFLSVDEKIAESDAIKKFKWYYWLDEKTLLSHAGLSRWWLDTLEVPKEKIHSWLRAEEKECWKNLFDNKLNWMYAAGRNSGGKIDCGGLTWCHPGEFVPIPGINQVYAHSFTNKLRSCYVQGYNYGLGNEMELYITYDTETESLSVKNYSTLLRNHYESL